MNIQRFLSEQKSPLTAREICAGLATNHFQMHVNKTELNKMLYQMLSNGQVIQHEGIPPKWSIKQNPVSVEAPVMVDVFFAAPDSNEPIMVVFIDLGNVHDCLKPIVPYAQKPNTTLLVHAFADISFNGFGVNPPAPPPIQVFQATTRDANAADVELIWQSACYILTRPVPQKYHFVVATRDQGFNSLKAIAKRHGHKLDFVTNWAQLKTFVE